MKLSSILPIVLVGALLATAAARPSTDVKVGSKAPELNCQDLTGKAIQWADFTEKAKLLYFHSSRTSNASHALDALAAELKKSPDVAGKTAIVVVVDNAIEGHAAAKALAESGCQVRVALAPEQKPQSEYGVFAFPSVFVLNGDQVIVEVIKGYGSLFGFEVTSAARLAAGLIKPEEYAALRAAEHTGDIAHDPRVSRVLHLARKLIAKDNLEMARAALEELAGTDLASRAPTVLLVHVLLKQGELDAAADWITRLEERAPEDATISILAARLLFLRGDVPAAEAKLATLDPKSAAARHLRGLIHESRGEWKEAAASYREGLETLLLEDR